ncbi:unnamed protein product [Rhizoctonia solani]|uniref:Phosphatidic acid phosphatase type 2/haloperoxidase domain-containing protein n=1 Tax=Rhizoctonia solani TaxID=456999 RepID=A0A8H3D866_9AGAM|nr:unnamed protein product [Rhizoctonia solani]
MTGVATHLVKVTVGRPRPDLLHRCQPVAGATNHPPNEFFGLATWTVCTQTNRLIMRDGWRSFWSGHASTDSFAGLSFLSYYMAGKLHMFDEQGYTVKVWATLSPFLVAILVTISRTVDNRHHWQDVTVGAIVGMNFGYFAYRQYYPSLADKLSHEAYQARLSAFERNMPQGEPDREVPRDEESAPLIDNYSERGMNSPPPDEA